MDRIINRMQQIENHGNQNRGNRGKPVPVSITLQWCSLQLISTVLPCALRKKGKCDETFWRIFTRGAHGVVSVLSICFMTEVVLLLAYSNFCCEY